MTAPVTARERALDEFEALDLGPAAFVARAPGRVNLIGEHTDYNDGFVLPMALPFDTVIVGSYRDDHLVSAVSEGFDPTTFDMSHNPHRTPGWGRYVHGMAMVLADAGHPTRGWRGALATDIPTGASLSSSAALEVAAGLAFVGPSAALDPRELAAAGQRVENEIMGLPSGIMDQLASAGSTAGSATLIDCRSLELRHVAVPPDVAVVVMDTGTRRELVDSEYAARRGACDRAAAALGVDALRDATLDDLERLGPHFALERQRAQHVIGENQRVLEAADALEAGRLADVGSLMNESHRSLSETYEVSSPALDLIVDIAQHTDGCIGARMTGGGFAGGAVALVDGGAVDAFVEAVGGRYEAPASQPATAPAAFYVVTPGAGASIEAS